MKTRNRASEFFEHLHRGQRANTSTNKYTPTNTHTDPNKVKRENLFALSVHKSSEVGQKCGSGQSSNQTTNTKQETPKNKHQTTKNRQQINKQQTPSNKHSIVRNKHTIIITSTRRHKPQTDEY
jgi:hypothetical protein